MRLGGCYPVEKTEVNFYVSARKVLFAPSVIHLALHRTVIRIPMKNAVNLLCQVTLVALLTIFSASAQVHVRGYYRSNGTYVQPHERTRPNYTITDNYSYPGNYNPNTGRVTGGSTPSSSYSQSYSETSSSYSPNSHNTNSGTSSSSRNSSNRHYVGAYPYSTKFDNPTFPPPLRSSPFINSSEVYSCPTGSHITVVESVTGTGYCKVIVDGRTGYVSEALLRIPGNNYTSSYSLPNNSYADYAGSVSSASFQTRFNNSTIKPPLRNAPTPEAREIYSCPKTAKVYVIGDVPNSAYCKVSVNGYIGFVSKALLMKQP